ncbi:hypothetical protein ACFLYJ_03325, partial [Candidatus Cloacimonadota bacterium]
VLQELKIDNKNILVVFNKADLAEGHHFKFVLKNLSNEFPDNVLVSAKTEEGFPNLIQKINEFIIFSKNETELNVPMELTNLIEFIRKHADILEENIDEENNELKIKMKLNQQLLPNIKKQIQDYKILKYIES